MTPSLSGLFALAGQAVWLQFGVIVAGTFILEDAATVLAAMQVAEGTVETWTALLALYSGIVLGDLGLYALGRLASRAPWLARLVSPARMRQGSGVAGRKSVPGRVHQPVYSRRAPTDLHRLRLPGGRPGAFRHRDMFGYLGLDQLIV